MIDETSGIWLSKDYKHWFDKGLAYALCCLFHNYTDVTVGDFGCGDGRYLAAFKLAGISCSGFDGNPYTEELTKGLGQILDLSQPVSLPEFDWILSLEVGEHIPKEHERTFILNLHKHCRRGIILSWAIPNQGGDGHVNEQPNAYIKRIFCDDLCYTNDMVIEERLRKITTLPWFKKTLMVFIR